MARERGTMALDKLQGSRTYEAFIRNGPTLEAIIRVLTGKSPVVEFTVDRELFVPGSIDLSDKFRAEISALRWAYTDGPSDFWSLDGRICLHEGATKTDYAVSLFYCPKQATGTATFCRFVGD